MLYLVMPQKQSDILSQMVEAAAKSAASGNGSQVIISHAQDLPDLRNKKIIFALELDASGTCPPIAQIFSVLMEKGKNTLSGAKAILLVHSPNALYTKSAAQNIIFLANQLGCSFPGHSIVEATGNLHNFLTWQKTLKLSLEEICLQQCSALGKRLIEEHPVNTTPTLLALHSSSTKTSNTLALWNIIKESLHDCTIEEYHVENGKVKDCKGCSFTTCNHYSNHNSCFYGGVMVEDVYPAIQRADAIIWLCPNYNDSISANLMAVINRLTALYRKTSFYNKYLFSVIVSGNSGSDIVAKQLIDALNINKGFRLPAGFALMETANDPGAILNVPDIRKDAKQFAEKILYALSSSL